MVYVMNSSLLSLTVNHKAIHTLNSEWYTTSTQHDSYFVHIYKKDVKTLIITSLHQNAKSVVCRVIFALDVP